MPNCLVQGDGSFPLKSRMAGGRGTFWLCISEFSLKSEWSILMVFVGDWFWWSIEVKNEKYSQEIPRKGYRTKPGYPFYKQVGPTRWKKNISYPTFHIWSFSWVSLMICLWFLPPISEKILDKKTVSNGHSWARGLGETSVRKEEHLLMTCVVRNLFEPMSIHDPEMRIFNRKWGSQSIATRLRMIEGV